MTWYIPSREAQHIVNGGWCSSHPNHQDDTPHHSVPHTSPPPRHAQGLRGASHPRLRTSHMPSVRATSRSHCRDLRDRRILAPFAPYPTPQTYAYQSVAKGRQRAPHACYNPLCDNIRATPWHAPRLYSLSSSFSLANSCGTPTAPRSLICVSGLRIIAVSGFPGSTR